MCLYVKQNNSCLYSIDIEFLFVSSTRDTNVSHLLAVLTLMQYLLEHSKRNSISLCGHATVFFSIICMKQHHLCFIRNPVRVLH